MPDRERHGPPWSHEGGHPGWGSGQHMFGRFIGFVLFLFLLSVVFGAVIVTRFMAFRGGHRWLALGVLILVFVGFVTIVRRMFGRSWGPVGDLIDATRRLGDGETGVRIETRAPGPFGAIGASFNRMAVRLEEEDERRRRLLADLGHELRTPLTVIRGEIEAVIDGVHDPSSLSHVVEEVELMERLLEDLRVMALAEAGRLQLHKEATDLHGLIVDLIASFAVALEGQGVVVEIAVEPGMAEIEVDHHRLRQVLGNLISNAVKQMPEGGRLEIAARDDPDTVVIEVSDTGPGIPTDRLETIFDRFVRAGDSAGTGLGLSIARDLVEAHDGTLTAANLPGRGAKFTIRLPVVS